MAFRSLIRHALNAYERNFKLISFFSIPFLIAFPAAFLLPNFTSLGATFLRLTSVRMDLTPVDALFIGVVFLVSLLLFSFALVAINVVIRAQRTLTRLTQEEIDRIETGTFKLFFIFLLAFAIVFLANIFLFESSPQNYRWMGSLFAFIVSLLVLFAPQAIVIDDLRLWHALRMSVSIIYRKLPYFFYFLVLACALVLFNDWIFISLQQAVSGARFIAIVTNALLIVPFLEVLKVQIYLSKYELLR